MFKRYPYTIGLMAAISFIVCVVWLFTHDACGSSVWQWVGRVVGVRRRADPVHRHRRGAGRRTVSGIVWQQWVILGYALLEHFILIGALRETKAKPGAVMYQFLRLVILCALVLTI